MTKFQDRIRADAANRVSGEGIAPRVALMRAYMDALERAGVPSFLEDEWAAARAYWYEGRWVDLEALRVHVIDVRDKMFLRWLAPGRPAYRDTESPEGRWMRAFQVALYVEEDEDDEWDGIDYAGCILEDDC